MDAGYTFFGSGRPRADRRDSGVAFAIWNEIVRRVPCLPQGINDRLISIRLSLQGGKFATLVGVYAIPMASPDRAKNKFYEHLHALLASVPKTNKLISLSDFVAAAPVLLFLRLRFVERWPRQLLTHGHPRRLTLRYLG
ncbi:hypothetical protein SprV_0902732500 [Sparganum proliferum]